MTDTGSILDAHTLRFKRLLPATPGRVWNYLTKPEQLAAWLAEGEIDLTDGGRVELRFDVEEAADRKKAGATIRGVVERCEPPHLLAYSWIDAAAGRPPGENPVPDSAVTFELEARGEESLLVLTHRRLPAALLPNCCAGWHAHLGILAARLRGAAPEPFLALYQRMLPVYQRVAQTVQPQGNGSLNP